MWMHRCLIPGLCSVAAMPVPVVAATSNDLTVPQWTVVPDQTLRDMRGGMDLGGLVASFAMDRVVAVDGTVVAQTRLVISNLDRLGSGGMPTISVSGPLAQVIQVASTPTSTPAQSATSAAPVNAASAALASLANVAPSATTGTAVTIAGTSSIPIGSGQAVTLTSLPNATIGTALQNTVNAATIQANTTISATLNSLTSLNALTLSSAIQRQTALNH